MTTCYIEETPTAALVPTDPYLDGNIGLYDDEQRPYLDGSMPCPRMAEYVPPRQVVQATYIGPDYGDNLVRRFRRAWPQATALFDRFFTQLPIREYIDGNEILFIGLEDAYTIEADGNTALYDANNYSRLRTTLAGLSPQKIKSGHEYTIDSLTYVAFKFSDHVVFLTQANTVDVKYLHWGEITESGVGTPLMNLTHHPHDSCGSFKRDEIGLYYPGSLGKGYPVDGRMDTFTKEQITPLKGSGLVEYAVSVGSPKIERYLVNGHVIGDPVLITVKNPVNPPGHWVLSSNSGYTADSVPYIIYDRDSSNYFYDPDNPEEPTPLPYPEADSDYIRLPGHIEYKLKGLISRKNGVYWAKMVYIEDEYYKIESQYFVAHPENVLQQKIEVVVRQNKHRLVV